MGKPAGGAVCESLRDVHADSPAKCVPHPEQSASHIVTDPELVRPSIPVMTHSLDQKAMARKAKARKCTAENVGNIQAKVDR